MEAVSWKFIGIAAALYVFAGFAFKYPEKFLHGRRSAFWIKVLGQEGAIKLVRFFSVPLVLVVATVFVLAGFGVVSIAK